MDLSTWDFKDLVEIVHTHYKDGHVCDIRLNKCSAWYSARFYNYDLAVSYVILQSYNTPVAIYIPQDKTVYRFGSWSSTTTQHQYKFLRAMGAEKMIDVGRSGLYRDWR